MAETLQEYVDSRGVPVRVDRQAGVIRGVKILGVHSRNARTYLPEALARAAALYEDAKVNVNHPKGNPGRPRDYQDRIGVIRNVVARGDEGLFADFHFNPKHPLAEQLAWDAEHAPQNVGFSHNVQARTVRQGDRMVVEAITKVQSVDLVADPATTRGLFESGSDAETPTEDVHAAAPWSTLTTDELRRRRADLVEAIREEIREEQVGELDRLREEVRRLTDLEQSHRRLETARRLLHEYRLPDPATQDPVGQLVVGGSFLESLTAAEDEAAMRRLIEERARLVHGLAVSPMVGAGHGAKPQARSQRPPGGNGRIDTRAFLEAIT
jgi:hypothetical protein